MCQDAAGKNLSINRLYLVPGNLAPVPTECTKKAVMKTPRFDPVDLSSDLESRAQGEASLCVCVCVCACVPVRTDHATALLAAVGPGSSAAVESASILVETLAAGPGVTTGTAKKVGVWLFAVTASPLQYVCPSCPF